MARKGSEIFQEAVDSMSKEQIVEIIKEHLCPSKFALDDNESYCTENCELCWKEALEGEHE